MSWMAVMHPNTALNLKQTAGLSAVGIVSFHLAYSSYSAWSFLILVYLYSLAALARQPSNRRAFYGGLVMGLLAYGPQLSCFYTIFGPAAVALWLVLAFWVALFGLLSRLCLARWGQRWAVALIPFVSTGLEYFRSELYYLRFSWLNAGYAFSDHVAGLPFGLLGVYGVGFLLMLVAAAANFLSRHALTAGVQTPRTEGRLKFLRLPEPAFACGLMVLTALGIWTNTPVRTTQPIPRGGLNVAGVQMEFPGDPQVVVTLNKLKKQHPEASLLVLSEYTFTEALPDFIKKWCRQNERYLIVGGKDFVGQTEFFDTAFVIDPHGEVIFRQAKSVPIQFFNDGLPARAQQLWASPWGKIGICICYDLSYTRVTDRLMQLGAQALVVPTMDLVDWGRHQHELHARIAPSRAAEYGVPIFRVASSGISQLVDAHGRVTATAPFPGEEAVIAGWLDIASEGRIPLDRVLARFSVLVTGLFLVSLLVNRRKRKSAAAQSPSVEGLPLTR